MTKDINERIVPQCKLRFTTGAGAQFSNLSEAAIIDDNLNLLEVFGMLLVDIILYMVIAWYVDAVKPGEFGFPLPPYFLFTVSDSLSEMFFI